MRVCRSYSIRGHRAPLLPRCCSCGVARWGVALALGLLTTLAAGRASADASSWLYFGAGPSRIDVSSTRRDTGRHYQLDLGMGSSPVNPFIIGGLGRMQWHAPDRPDFALLMRGANQAFVSGGWGFGVDLGGYRRWWGRNSTGVMAEAVFGAPFGVTLIAGGSAGSAERRTYFASIGIDFARLTAHNVAYSEVWPNPFPSPRLEEQSALR